MTLVVRLAMPWDKAGVIELARLQVEETHAHLDFRPDLVAETFRNAITKGDPALWVAADDSGLVGFLWARIYEYAFSSGIFVSQEVLFVRPDKRGTRAAVKLIDEYKSWGDMLGAREILFGVSNGRQPDRVAKLFQRKGAELVGHHLRIVRA